jgi:hypothetical protein
MQRLRLSLFLLIWALPSVARADEAAPSLRVFYTGHSFHMFVPGRMAEIAKAAGLSEYQLVGRQGLGGSRVQQHWDLPEERNQARKTLEKGGVDVFTMSPHVKLPDEGIDRFVELGLKHNPRMRFLVQESWVPWDSVEKRIANNSQRDQTDLARLRADQEKWRGQMEAQVRTINQKAGRTVVSIVPAGDAVLKLRELIAAGKAPGIARQAELFRDTIGHGNAPVVLLVSYCNFACITGRSPIGLKVKEEGISDELNALLQRIAWETVTAYSMSGVKAAK